MTLQMKFGQKVRHFIRPDDTSGRKNAVVRAKAGYEANKILGEEPPPSLLIIDKSAAT